MRSVLLGLLALAGSAFAGDVSGKWSGTAESTDGDGKTQSETVYLQLVHSGTQLTGTLGDGSKEWAISNGKVEGDKVAFEVTTSADEPTWYFRLVAAGEELTGEASALKNGRELSGRVKLKRAPSST